MNIKRGFLRLWTVLTVVFITGSIATDFPNLKLAFEKEGTVDIVLPNGQHIDNIPADMDPRTLREKLVKNGIIGKNSDITADLKTPAEQFLDGDKTTFNAQEFSLTAAIKEQVPAPSAWPILASSLAFAFGIPFGILFSAYVFAWVVLGFKKLPTSGNL